MKARLVQGAVNLVLFGGYSSANSNLEAQIASVKKELDWDANPNSTHAAKLKKSSLSSNDYPHEYLDYLEHVVMTYPVYLGDPKNNHIMDLNILLKWWNENNNVGINPFDNKPVSTLSAHNALKKEIDSIVKYQLWQATPKPPVIYSNQLPRL